MKPRLTYADRDLIRRLRELAEAYPPAGSSERVWLRIEQEFGKQRGAEPGGPTPTQSPSKETEGE